MAGRGSSNYGAGGEWDLLFGSPEDAQAKAQALAAALRGQQQDALALQALTGGPRAMPQIGQTLAQNAQQELGGLGQAAGERLRMAIQERARQQQQAQQDALMSLHERQFAEAQRHNLASEKNAAERPSPFQIVVGEGGAQYYVNPRNPKSPAIPVVGPTGEPIAKPKQAKTLQTGDKKTIDDITGEINALDNLSAQFKPEFAGGGPLGGAATAIYQKLGSAGSRGMQQDAAFWSDFSRLIDLPQRNAIFGASLSAGEKASWEGAKNIKPGSDPALVQRKLGEMRGILARKLSNIGESLAAEGYDTGAIQARSGGLYGGEQTGGTAPVPTRQRIPVTRNGVTRYWNGTGWED